MHKLKIFFIYNFFSAIAIHAQLSLINPSFEGTPSDATMPSGWFKCTETTTPDILPGPWGVSLKAAHGNTYLGIITRKDGSFEAIAQRLEKPLLKDQCYSFSFYLANSDTYASYSDHIGVEIWLGQEKCNLSQRIFHSPVVSNSEWKKIHVDFIPNAAYEYIRIQATDNKDGSPKKGNILLDHFSEIQLCEKA